MSQRRIELYHPMKRSAADGEGDSATDLRRISRIVRNVLTSLGNHARVVHGKAFRLPAIRENLCNLWQESPIPVPSIRENQ